MGTQIFLGKPPANIEQWIKANFQSDQTIYKVQTTSTYKNTGIYSAERNKASKPVKIDWGDGTVETVDGNISQKTHTYDSVSEFTVKVSNIKTFAANANNGTWYSTTSQNRYTLKELVNLNKAVTSIGDHAFFNCANLVDMTIPDNVTSIGDHAFQGCSGLTSVTIPDSVTSIGVNAFTNCKGLMSIIIGDGVTSIGQYAFESCSGLTNVTIGNGMASIGRDAFYECTSTTDVYCYPNPINLTWDEDGKDDFKDDGSTNCHVKAEYLAAYQTKFGSTVNVTFVGDLT